MPIDYFKKAGDALACAQSVPIAARELDFALTCLSETPRSRNQQIEAAGYLMRGVVRFVNQMTLRLNPEEQAEMLAGLLSDGQMVAVKAVNPLTDLGQWGDVLNATSEITVARRAWLKEQAQALLDHESRSDVDDQYTILQRHRLEIWAEGLVPQDMQRFAQSTTIAGRALILPEWQIDPAPNPEQPTVIRFAVTRLPNMLWDEQFYHLMAQALSWAYSVDPDPDQTVIIDAIYTAIQRGLEQSSVTLGFKDHEYVPLEAGLVYLIDVESGTVVLDPQYRTVAEETIDPAPVQTIDPESLLPHGQALQEAQARQDQLLAPVEQAEPAIDPESLRPHGAGLSEAQARQEQLLTKGDAKDGE